MGIANNCLIIGLLFQPQSWCSARLRFKLPLGLHKEEIEFPNSLIIHEETIKEIYTVKEVWIGDHILS